VAGLAIVLGSGVHGLALALILDPAGLALVLDPASLVLVLSS
jgi:voltage-gated potassium channel Kch